MTASLEVLRSMLLLAATLGLLWVLTQIARALWRGGWRLSLLYAVVILGSLVGVVTEALSALNAISLVGVLAAWALVWLVAVAILRRASVRSPNDRPSSARADVAKSFGALGMPQKAIAGYAVVSASILGLSAFISAPNTWDALTYHLSRVMHWMQDQNLHFYATAIQRQLVFGPWAEMAMLNFQLLAGTDQLANLVQFLALLGCLIGVSLLAERLGADADAQWLAVVASVTMPMAVLQSTSTQNDLVTALWCMCFVLFCLIQMEEGASIRVSLLAGAALGLALLTKATAFIYTAPFGLWLAGSLLRRDGLRAWKPLLVLLAVALIVAAPQASRNQALYGNPLGLTSGEELGNTTNQAFSLPILASNILRNTGSELATPFEPLNRAIDGAIVAAHNLMSLDVNDPRTTWPGVQYDVFFFLHEDSVSNPLHLLLIVVAAVLLAGRRQSRALAYMLCLLAGFLILCLLLRWQPWASRFHMPLLLLAMPLVGVALSRYLRGRRVLVPATILALVAIPCLIVNPARPLLGANNVFVTDRLRQYFTTVPDSYAAYDAAARAIAGAGCDRVGLITGFDGREYLAWVTIRAYVPRAELQDVLVKNISARYATDFNACAVVVMHATPTHRLTVQNRDYEKVLATDELELFLPSSSPPTLQ